MHDSLRQRIENHQQGDTLVIHPGEVTLGANGRMVVQQLRRPEMHINDTVTPTPLLEHMCRAGVENVRDGKAEACPFLSVALCHSRIQGLTIQIRGACRECAGRFASNLEKTN